MMLSTNALSANGVAMEEQIAMAVAMNEVLQDSSRTGNALKSISANMSGVIFGLKEGDVQANKTAKALESLTGIKLFDEQTGEVMDMYEAMEQLNGKWDGLTEAQKSSIAQTIAGKQNLQSFLALMDNWDTARQYVDDYNKSVGEGNEIVGSASRENEQYLDSIQGKWNTIKENLKSIGTNLISSDMVKGVLDGIGKITEALAKFTSTDFGSLMTSITGIVGGFKLLSGVLKTFKGFDFLKDVFGSGSITKDFSTIGTALKKTTSTVKSFGASLVGLATAHPVLTALVATAVAVGGAWYYVETANERAIKKSQKVQAEMKKEIDLEQKKIDSLGSIAEEYDNLYFKTNKTDEELARYKELTNEIANIYPELVTGYDASGDPILALKGNAEAYLSTLKEVQAERERVLNEEQNKEGDLQKKQLEETMKAYDELKKKQSELANSEQYAFNYNPALDKQMYDEAKRLYEEYQKERIAINEQALNDLQSKKFYEGLSDGYKKEIDEMFRDTFDFANLFKQQGQEGVDSFLNEVHKLEDGFTETSKLTDEQIEKNNKLSESYNKQKINLDTYTDSLRKNYEEQGKIDFDSFDRWYDSVQAYAEKTGDLKGANDQIREMVGFLSELTGLDPVDLVQLLGIDGLDISPLTEAEKRLNSFLESYGTASSNLGKGGLADKIESEFKAIESAQKSLMKMDRSELTIPTLIKLTAESTGNVQDLVTEMISKGIDEEVMYDVMLNVTTDIANGGEISDTTIAQISEILDMPEEEVRARFTVKADIQNQQEIDDLLKKYDDLDLETEAKIRTVVDNKEEAETLYNTLKKIDDEETRAKVIADFGNAKQEAMELGTTINGLPPEKKLEYHMVFDGADKTIGNIENIVEKMNEVDGKEVRAQLVAEMDNQQILMFNDVLSQVDGKTATAFLQADGAIEALAQCESVEEMLALIENYKATGEIGIEVEGEEGIQATKTSMEQIDGMRAEGIVTVQTEEEGLRYMQGQLVELDGKTYMVTINADTQEKELVEFKGKVEEINGKTATANVNANVSGKDDVTQLGEDVKNLPTDASVEVEAKVKQDSKGGILNTIKGWFSGGTTQSVEVDVKGKMTSVEPPSSTNLTVDVKGKVSDVEVPTTTDSTVDVKGKVSDIEMPSTTNASIDVKGKVTDIEMPTNTNATINVKANVTGAEQINTLKNNISTLQNKTVSVSTSVTGNSEVQALKNSINTLQNKTVSVTANVTGTNNVSSLTSAIGTVLDKTVSVTANVTGTDAVNALADAISSVKSKSVSIKATTSGKSAVDSLASSIANVKSKTVSVSVTKTVSNIVKNIVKNVTKGSIPTEGNTQSINAPQTVNSSNLSSIPISASDTPTEGAPSLANVPISAKASYSTASVGNIIASLENGISTYKNLEEALEKISTYFGIIEKKSENAFGKEKIELLKHQVDLLGQQQDMVKQVGEAEKQQYDQLKNVLTQKGFYFDEFDNIINYQQKILDLTQYAEELKNASDEASNNQAENAEYLKWMYEEASKELSTCEKYLDEFFNTNKQMLDASAEWQEYENAIIEAREEIEALNRELRLTPIQNTASELTTYLEDINNRIDMIDEAWGNSDNETEYLKAQDQLIEANNKKLDLLYAQFRRLKTLQDSLKEELNQYGFSYTAEGLLANYDEVLNSLVGTQAYDTVKDLAEEYMNLVVNDMAEIELEVLKTNNAIKDIHDNLKKMEEEAEEARKKAEEERLEGLRDNLEKTKDIEDKITEIYEKEYNRRKKEIEDFTDAQIKLLEKQKDAYNEMREEQDYEKGARERVDEIEELRRKLAIAEKDNSIAGIKRQKEIRKELADAEEELAEYTQDKIDDDYNESIDKEIEVLEQQQQALLDSLAETFSENNIAKMVQEALLTGFVEVNGEVVTLQEAMLETIEDSTDAYSVMGNYALVVE